jgi:hypothetical protein
LKTPGIIWRERARGRVAYWAPTSKAVAAGYPSGVVPLEDYQDNPAELAARCQSLQADMQLWLDGYRRERAAYDGTIGSVLRLYQTHPESPYRTLKPSSLRPYMFYLGKLEKHIGKRRVAAVIAMDVKGWFKTWTDDGRVPAAGGMCVAVLKAALRFACACGYEECRRIRTSLEEDITFPSSRPRTAVVTADGVTKARRAAHAAGRPSRALAYALQFETALRAWDVKGQWVPLEYAAISDVIYGHDKWVGLRWEHIGEDLVLRYRPSKTDDTTRAEVAADLKHCPMVLEELASLPERPTIGAVIVNEYSGRPYTKQQWERGWRQDRRDAGLPKTLWNRDLLASAITEARSGAVSLDDAAKVAGHWSKRTTGQVYDREVLEAQRRFQAARQTARKDVS